ncbi:hypothetical protein FF011L_48750 [Roseimaritima multifibrata]|uniref:Prolyl 4-hydroxylase alpha subunit Fe(2+) 2OG dioxygenase domain-containing protein n=1 Tax=Roseimaritima multifibrata TaxID=1930274 RepID=A0A517MMG9_9BACT|nr:2OG-Fe(II) oxygenase [Roseimaritima multifibrata]QDS96071.1 hypothetical protein FF011L_48750 [Roseimaritima multifibrata]
MSNFFGEYISEIDLQKLATQAKSAQPFPHFMIDNFLVEEFANEIENSFPRADEIAKRGKSFKAVNERGKTQVTNTNFFPAPLKRLNEILASSEWLCHLEEIMGIENLLADPGLLGGGIHQTGPRGHLDVHVDFNFHQQLKLHRRLNILIYFNRDWQEPWGGNVELWDKEVKNCIRSFSPILNRCVVFATNDISFHGVTRVDCPPDATRNSYAAYYYTKEPPPEWTGVPHSTIFRARPNEQVKSKLLMPLEKMKRKLGRLTSRLFRHA